MNKINWAQKLTSRKLWLAVAGLIVGVLALFGTDANTTEQISGVILSLGSVVAYIVGEGLVDAAAAGSSSADVKAVSQYLTPIVGTIDPAAAKGTPTGAAQGAEIKQDTALGSETSEPGTTSAT